MKVINADQVSWQLCEAKSNNPNFNEFMKACAEYCTVRCLNNDKNTN